jgi:glucan biosynthesis protein
MAIAAYTGLSATGLLAARAWAANGGAADGEAQAFDFEALKRQAKQLAGSLSGHQAVLPPTLATMTPQNFNAIRYDGNIRCGRKTTVSWTCSSSTSAWVSASRCACTASIRRPAPREVHFRPTLFNYENTTVDTQQLKGDLGFAGFKLFKAPELDRHDVVSFLGASYFRAVDATGQYGLSARGLASTPTQKARRVP